MTFRLIAGATAMAAAAMLSACSASSKEAAKEGKPAASASQSAQPAGGHNDDDVMFAQMMIPHHEQAVELAALVPDRSTDAAVIKLAATISGEQQPEIDFMKSTLNGWGAAGGHGGMAMAGMVDAATMARLQGLKGRDFDTLWLRSMIAHHEGAIQMAKTEVEVGADPEMTALARSIITAQQAEIDQMKQMLGG